MLIERYVPGRELAVTVLGPAEAPEVLPVIEIETDEPFYTFRAHYEPGRGDDARGGARRRRSASAWSAVAAEAYRAAGCRDLGRVDLILDESATSADPRDQHDPGPHGDRPDALRRAGGRHGLHRT